jgi:hypothetical protein
LLIYLLILYFGITRFLEFVKRFGNRSNFRKVMISRISDDGQSPKTQ